MFTMEAWCNIMAENIEIILSSINGLTLNTKDTIIEKNIIIKMDEASLANLMPENIVKGVTIMGVEGTYEGESLGELVNFTITFCGYEWDEDGVNYNYRDPLPVSGSYSIGSRISNTSFSNLSSLSLQPREKEVVSISINEYDVYMAPGVLENSNCEFNSEYGSTLFTFTNFIEPATAKIQVNDV